LIYLESATVVSEYNEDLCAPAVNKECPKSLQRMPAVIRLMPDVEPKRKVRYSKLAIFVRDSYSCQYCGKRTRERELTQDHLVPRKNGGKTSFENIVAACKPCNLKKGCLTCDEAGMFPRKVPVKPKVLPLVAPIRDLDHAPEEWHDYLRPYIPTFA
jgi:5-methylcytosine-specific restriction endonuclease McrA